MHELGIVFHIIRTVEDACRDNAILRVSSVTLQLGEVSGVIPHYLEDAWRWASNKNPLVVGSELKVEEIPAVTYCEDCKKTYETVAHGKTCPHCGSSRTYLVQGQEVMVKEIETPDEQLSREPRPLPKLRLNPAVKSVFDFRYEDFTLEGYDPWPAIKAPMSF